MIPSKMIPHVFKNPGYFLPSYTVNPSVLHGPQATVVTNYIPEFIFSELLL